MTPKDLIKLIEKAKVCNFRNGNGFHHLIDADILLAELKKMEE